MYHVLAVSRQLTRIHTCRICGKGDDHTTLSFKRHIGVGCTVALVLRYRQAALGVAGATCPYAQVLTYPVPWHKSCHGVCLCLGLLARGICSGGMYTTIVTVSVGCTCVYHVIQHQALSAGTQALLLICNCCFVTCSVVVTDDLNAAAAVGPTAADQQSLMVTDLTEYHAMVNRVSTAWHAMSRCMNACLKFLLRMVMELSKK